MYSRFLVALADDSKQELSENHGWMMASKVDKLFRITESNSPLLITSWQDFDIETYLKSINY